MSENKTHVIDGVTYVEVERKAKVGEKVIVISPAIGHGWYNSKVGELFEVIDGSEYGFTGGTLDIGAVYVESGSNSNGCCAYISRNNYRVVEPLESEEVAVDTTQASPEVIEMLANLARRVTSLERQLADTQRNVERQAEELENAKHRISKHATMFGSVEEKIEMLVERTNYRSIAKEMARRLSR